MLNELSMLIVGYTIFFVEHIKHYAYIASGLILKTAHSLAVVILVTVFKFVSATTMDATIRIGRMPIKAAYTIVRSIAVSKRYIEIKKRIFKTIHIIKETISKIVEGIIQKAIQFQLSFNDIIPADPYKLNLFSRKLKI